MVQIIPENPSFSSQVARGLGGGFGQGFAEAVGARQKNLQAMQLEQAKASQQILGDQEGYDITKKHFGEKFADIWKTAPQGARTELIKAALDSRARGVDLEQILSKIPDVTKTSEEIPSESQEYLRTDTRKEEKLDIPDYTKAKEGFTPKEWANIRSGWAKNNNETLNTARDRIKGNKRDVLGTKKLQQLNESEELPEGLERWLINPHSGEIYGVAQLAKKAPRAAQEWVKEISRFGNRAKDAFGSRVTNFDLLQYMKQFPSLMNTAEGRRSILRMMEINYQLDSLYDSAVQRILDQKGALNIPPEEVDRFARKMIQDKEQQLSDEYLNLDEKNQNAFLQEGLSSERPSLEEIFG